VDGLNKLIEDVRKRIPGARYYLESGEMHIMDGPSHDGDGRGRQDAVLESELLEYSDGGAW